MPALIKLSQKQEQTIIQTYKSGMTLNETSILLGFTIGVICRVLRRNNIERNRYRAIPGKFSGRKAK